MGRNQPSKVGPTRVGPQFEPQHHPPYFTAFTPVTGCSPAMGTQTPKGPAPPWPPPTARPWGWQ